MYKLRTFDCHTCGEPVKRRAPEGTVAYCVPCGILRSAENARQLHAHSGPLYERWLSAHILATHRHAASLPSATVRRIA